MKRPTFFRHNGKLFVVFTDENGKKTFLRLNKNKKEHNISLEDLIYLNNRYDQSSNSNVFIKTISKLIKDPANIFLIATITLLFASIISEQSETSKVVIKNMLDLKKNIEIDDLSQLDEFLEYQEVSIDDVHRAIDDNKLFNEYYRSLSHTFVDFLTLENPDVDLRAFYENIKDLEINIVDEEYFSNNGQSNVIGTYNPILNQIDITKDFSQDTFYHEICHSVDTFYIETDDAVIYNDELFSKRGQVFSEPMTNVGVNCIRFDNTYDKYREVLEFFCNYVDFDYTTFVDKGINYFIELVKEKYQDVDINYIINTLYKMKNKEENEDYIYLDEEPKVLDELFKVCKIEALKNYGDIYKPFSNFARVLEYTTDRSTNKASIMYKYLEQYNILLGDMGYQQIISKDDLIKRCESFLDVKKLAIYKGEVLPVVDEFIDEEEDTVIKVINQDGSTYEISDCNGFYIFYWKFLPYYVQLTALENYDDLGSTDYWKKIATSSRVLDPYLYSLEKTPIYCNGELLSEKYIEDLWIKVGTTADNRIGYELSNSEGDVFYQSDSLLFNLSNQIRFEEYIRDIPLQDIGYIELSTILNEDYLRVFLENNHKNIFFNVLMDDDEIKITPNYIVTIYADGKDISTHYGSYFFETKDGKVTIRHFGKYEESDDRVYLKNILDYYHLLDEETLEYEFTIDEIFDYYHKYMDDIFISTAYQKIK